MGWESLADFLNNYTWDDTEILYQIADNCGMIVADWIERGRGWKKLEELTATS